MWKANYYWFNANDMCKLGIVAGKNLCGCKMCDSESKWRNGS